MRNAKITKVSAPYPPDVGASGRDGRLRPVLSDRCRLVAGEDRRLRPRSARRRKHRLRGRRRDHRIRNRRLRRRRRNDRIRNRRLRRRRRDQTVGDRDLGRRRRNDSVLRRDVRISAVTAHVSPLRLRRRSFRRRSCGSSGTSGMPWVRAVPGSGCRTGRSRTGSQPERSAGRSTAVRSSCPATA